MVVEREREVGWMGRDGEGAGERESDVEREVERDRERERAMMR